MRVVKHWNGPSRETEEYPSLEIFKILLSQALSNLA